MTKFWMTTMVAIMALGLTTGCPDGDDDADADCIPACAPGYVCLYGDCVPEGSDTDADADSDTAEDDADTSEADADTTDNGADADADNDDSATTCGGGWLDPATSLCWQNPANDPRVLLNWGDAVAYCAGLSLAGHGPGSWHLPTISELRSLVRDCPTMTGGSCGVTDTCLHSDCWDMTCHGCPELMTPPTYCPAALDGATHAYWSSSPDGDETGIRSWFLDCSRGAVNSRAGVLDVRCVRPGP